MASFSPENALSEQSLVNQQSSRKLFKDRALCRTSTRLFRESKCPAVRWRPAGHLSGTPELIFAITELWFQQSKQPVDSDSNSESGLSHHCSEWPVVPEFEATHLLPISLRVTPMKNKGRFITSLGDSGKCSPYCALMVYKSSEFFIM